MKYLMGSFGYSYLWMLYTIVLLSISSLVIIDAYQIQTKRANEIELLFIGQEFRDALESYCLKSNEQGINCYPTSVEDLLKDNRSLKSNRHLRKIYVDPITGKKDWVYLKVSNRIVGFHSSSNDSVLKKEGFRIENLSLSNKSSYSDWKFTYPPNLLIDLTENQD